MIRKSALLAVVFSLAAVAAAQAGPAVVAGNDLKKVVPDTYFFRGLSATVQARNSAAVKYPDGYFVIAALVDTSGYSTDIKAKYNGLLITEKKLVFGGKTIDPGEYGMGYTPEGRFHILDVAGNELAAGEMVSDAKLAHPVPLAITTSNGEVRLYLGKKYAVITAQ